MYIGVKLLYKHDGTPQGYLTKRFPTPSPNDRRVRSVEKVQQNNMALQMNATFLKVLKEVLLGLPHHGTEHEEGEQEDQKKKT